MLLQGSPSVRQQDPAVRARNEQNDARTGQRHVAAAPASAAVRRTYPPITWSSPGLGRVIAAGLGGITRTALLLMLLGAVFIGVAITVAIVVTQIVGALGFDPSSSY